MKHLLALFVAIPIIAAACGGASKTPAGASPKDATALAATAVAQIVPVGPTRSPAEATAVSTQYDLVDFHHDAVPRREGTDIIDFPYVIALPKGWTTSAVGVTVTATLTPPGATYPTATITVDCRPGVDKSLMIQRDSELAKKANLGNLTAVGSESTKVAGRDAIRVRWRGGAYPADRMSVYVDGQSCAWRLQINAFGALKADDFAALFTRVLDRFDPAQGLPAGQ